MNPNYLETAFQEMLRESYTTMPNPRLMEEMRKVFFAGAVSAFAAYGNKTLELGIHIELTNFAEKLKNWKPAEQVYTEAGSGRPNSEEVRRHRDALAKAVRSPCDCLARGQEHEFQCRAGGAAMNASIKMLEWVLGVADERTKAVIAKINEQNT